MCIVDAKAFSVSIQLCFVPLVHRFVCVFAFVQYTILEIVFVLQIKFEG